MAAMLAELFGAATLLLSLASATIVAVAGIDDGKRTGRAKERCRFLLEPLRCTFFLRRHG